MEEASSYTTLLLSVENAVATIALNRRQSMNALNMQMFDELAHAFHLAATTEEVRVILITGAGDKAFAGGADIRELADVGRLGGERFARRGQDIFQAIESCGKPVIACINGFALGGGCELAMACTLRIASETAKLGQPEIRLGLLPGYGGSQRLPRLIGRSAALKMMLTGEMVSAAEALRLRLVDEVVSPEDLMPRCRQIAKTIAGMPVLAVTACMDAVRIGLDTSLERGLDIEAQLFARLCGTLDKQEGVAAFLEKRPPVWSGH